MSSFGKLYRYIFQGNCKILDQICTTCCLLPKNKIKYGSILHVSIFFFNVCEQYNNINKTLFHKMNT